MSEVTATTIAKADKAGLLEMAELLGCEVDSTMTVADIRVKLRAAIGAPPSADEKPVAVTEYNPEEIVEIYISPDKTEKQPAVVSLEGVAISLPRGKWWPIKRKFVKVLEESIVTVYDPQTLEPTDTPTYPFQVRAKA